MAEDVNTTPRALAGEKFPQFRTSARGGSQFRATEMWNDIVATLKAEVDVKKRRVKMKSYDDCFTGADAVDVVFHRLQTERINFTKDVSRDKAHKLCRLLMDNKVFEPVSSKSGDDTKSEFDDSSSKLYRFIEDEKENEETDGGEEKQGTSSNNSSKDESQNKQEKHSLSYTYSPVSGRRVRQAWTEEAPPASSPQHQVSLTKHGNLVQELMDITGAWKRHSAECLRKITPAKMFQRRASLSSISSLEGETPRSRRSRLPPAVVAEVRQEVVISRLLTLVDLPVLDDILRFDINAPSHHTKKQSMAYSNLAFKRQESLTSLFEKKDDDLWLESATDLLELVPKGDEVLDQSFTEDTERTRKLRLYMAVADHYKQTTPPLWPAEFTDLQVALLNLLMQGRRGTVLQALQLSMMLLPSSMQEEIYRILSFMSQAAKVTAVRLSNQMCNRDHLEKVFTSTLIKNKVLAPHQAAQLVWFLVDHQEAVFSVPPDVEDAIQTRLDAILYGRQDNAMELIYCHQVSLEEFRRQQLDDTQHALVELMNTILDNTDISLKEKKQRLKAFHKHHPALHEEFFSHLH